MKRSSDRILTSHVGSLPRPEDLLQLYRSDAPPAELEPRLTAAVADVVRAQTEVGIDIVNDGEFGKPMTDDVDYAAWSTYAYGRLSNIETQAMTEDEFMAGVGSRDRTDFAEFYESGDAAVSRPGGASIDIGTCVGPVEYTGQALVERDIANLKAALQGVEVEDAFISSVALSAEAFMPGDYYTTDEEQATASAEAMREEYKAITDAGFSVQIDDPILVNVFELSYSMDWDMKGFRKWAQSHIELVNHSLDGIPEDMVRYHVCWGSWKGPHSSDLPLKDVIDLIFEVDAAQYSVEAANVQHEHEWKVWRDAELPDGKMVIPGVVTHKTNVLEHRELVADRIVRYAEAVGRENVIAGTDCGMGGRLHPQLAWAKLKALTEGAALASEQLWG